MQSQKSYLAGRFAATSPIAAFLSNTPWICREVKSCIASGKHSQLHGHRTVITVQFTTVKPAQPANKGRRRLFTPERRRKSGSGSRLPTGSYRENFKVNIDESSRSRNIEGWILLYLLLVESQIAICPPIFIRIKSTICYEGKEACNNSSKLLYCTKSPLETWPPQVTQQCCFVYLNAIFTVICHFTWP